MKKPIEVRRDPPTKREPDGPVDEIVAKGVIHIERMNGSEFYIGIDGEAGDTINLFVAPARRAKNGKAPHVRVFVSSYETRAEKAAFRRKFVRHMDKHAPNWRQGK